MTWTWEGGGEHTAVDPWAFWPTLGDLDLHLVGEGHHDRLWTVLGANAREHQGTEGTAFAVGARGPGRAGGGRLERLGRPGPPHAQPGRLGGLGDLRARGAPGQRYKFEVVEADGGHPAQGRPAGHGRPSMPPGHRQRGVPVGLRVGRRRVDGAAGRGPARGTSGCRSTRSTWARGCATPTAAAWATGSLAERLADHVADLGFTHVELLPPTEHPYGRRGATR